MKDFMKVTKTLENVAFYQQELLEELLAKKNF